MSEIKDLPDENQQYWEMFQKNRDPFLNESRRNCTELNLDDLYLPPVSKKEGLS